MLTGTSHNKGTTKAEIPDFSRMLSEKSLIERLHTQWSSQGFLRIAEDCLRSPEMFQELMEILLHGSPREQQRASYSLAKISDIHPTIFRPYTQQLLTLIVQPVHTAIVRSILRIWMQDDPGEAFHGELTQISFDVLSNRELPPACRMYAMQVLGNLCEQYPDLWPELKSIIESGMPVESPSFRAVGRKLLKKFNRKKGHS